jgi:pyoverdine/dityrosine biosynthesis protein Dit1
MTAIPMQSKVAGTPMNYDYVSFSRLNFTHELQQLIEAAAICTSIESEQLDRFDHRDFRKALAAANPIPEELVNPLAGGDLADRILFVLSHNRYRAGAREFVENAKQIFLAKISAAMAAGRPIEIIVPSFPGREVNPIARTRPQLHLGELAALCRLSEIAELIESIYKPGLRFIIVGDGVAYAPFYGDPIGGAIEYKRCLVEAIERLGCEQHIGFEDLADVIAERQDEFDILHATVEEEIKEVWNNPDYLFRDELAFTMRMGTQSAALNAAAIQLVKFPQPGQSDAEILTSLREAIAAASEKTAFAYQCLLVTLRRMELLDRRFPNAIRGTVHAKIGQYAPHLVNEFTSISPWHGMPVMRANGRVDIVYEAEILAEPSRYTGVYLRGEVLPFFYKDKH